MQATQYVPMRHLRTAWFVMAVLTALLYALGIVPSFEVALRLQPESIAALDAAGLPYSLPAWVLLITDTGMFLVFLATATLLVWRRGEEPGALVVASMLLATGGLYTGPTANANLPFWVLAILPGLAETFQAWFVFLFPTGRAGPRWMWWILLPLPIWRIGIWALDYMPTYKTIHHTAENYSYTPQQAWDIVPFMILLVLGIVSQVYRYRNLSTPAQRQQTKWVMFGAALTLGFVGTYVLLFNVLGYGEDSSLLIALIARVLRQMALSIIPVTMAIAVLRYRLWEVDFTINRSLVYAALTALLGLVFAISLWGISIVAQDFAFNTLTALAVAAIIFAIIFQPARAMLQRFVDQRFYHIYIDYQKPQQSRIPTLDAEAFPRPQFNDYTNLSLAGRGGMAEVYRATHPTLGRDVAIKVMRSQTDTDEKLRAYFARETDILRKLDHPNIIKVLDAGIVDDRPYMVMEFVPGPALGEWLNNHKTPDALRAKNLLTDIARALDYLHAQRIIHRDVKPANILLDNNQQPERPVLSDFGLARVMDAASASALSGVAGTFAYIAPEQIQVREDIDGRADIYALGIMAYELLTGELPFQHENPGALLIAHMLHPAPNARERNPNLSEETSAAIQKALSKEPFLRFDSAMEFVKALNL